MIKHKRYLSYHMERLPKRCNECPAFRQIPYSCHNERGTEGYCELGYMRGYDMRDFNGYKQFGGCIITVDPRVKITRRIFK